METTRAKVQRLVSEGYNKSQIARMTGVSRQRVHQIIGGYSTLPFHESDIAQRVIKDRCQVCGIKASYATLQVHHMDKNPHNNDVSNLQILCIRCHSNAHRKVLPIKLKPNFTKDEKDTLSIIWKELGSRGGKAKFSNMTLEEKERYMLKMREARRIKAAKVLTDEKD